MKCKNPDCGKDIDIDHIMYPPGEYHKPDRIQHEHPFPVALCPYCKKLNSVVRHMDSGVETTGIVEEESV